MNVIATRNRLFTRASPVPWVRRNGFVVVWVATVLWLTTPMAVGLAPRYQELVRTCTAACTDRAVGVVNQEQANLLAHVGVKLPLYASWDIAREAVFAAASVLVATILVLRLRSFVGALVGVTIVATGAVLVPEAPIAAERVEALPHVVLSIMIATALLSVGLLFFVLPDGRWVSAWSRSTLIVLGAAGALILVLPPVTAIESEWARSTVLIALIGTGIAAQCYRFTRSSTELQRQQLKWFGAGLGAWVGTLLFYVIAFDGFLATSQHETGYPLMYLALELVLSAAASVPMFAWSMASLRHRLWDVDYILSRASLASLMMVLAVGTYVATTLAVTAAASSRAALAGPIASVILVLGIIPVRSRANRAISRLLYGERDAPYELLAGLWSDATNGPPDREAIDRLARRLASSLHLTAVRVRTPVEYDPTIEVTIGEPFGEFVEVPLESNGEIIGTLTAWQRTGDTRFGSREREIVKTMAAPFAHVTAIVRLTGNLSRSRGQIVRAREEERRRVHRDLHDDLGPTLASQVILLDTAKDVVADDPWQAIMYLDQAKIRSSEVLAGLRRIAADLRPLPLDQLGLAAALERAVASVPGAGAEARVGHIGELPPAIEVAAYRVATEALANAVRHANASRILVDARQEGDCLMISVSDDGEGGLWSQSPGVGVSSMHARANELGGTLTIDSTPGVGTTVSLVLPTT